MCDYNYTTKADNVTLLFEFSRYLYKMLYYTPITGILVRATKYCWNSSDKLLALVTYTAIHPYVMMMFLRYTEKNKNK